MADPSFLSTTERVDEIIESYLIKFGGRRLAPDEMTVWGGAFRTGWRIDIQLADRTIYKVNLLLPPSFPFDLPRLALTDGPVAMSWPHLEDSGLLCVFDSALPASPERPLDVVKSLIHEGVGLIEAGHAGTNTADFQREFMTYWSRSQSPDALRRISLLKPHGEHRRIAVWRAVSFSALAENENDLLNWLRNSGLRPGKEGEFRIYPALLLWLPAPLLPTEFPKIGSDLHKLFASDQRATDLLADLASKDEFQTEIALATRTATGVGFGVVHPQKPIPTGAPGRRSDPRARGFRPGRIPPGILLARALPSNAKVERSKVVRADHEWVHGRDADPRQAVLKTKRVAYVGCGSLGSSVAMTLARAGVGGHLFIDGDSLSYENLSRHVLGASDVLSNKARALAKVIKSTLPHLAPVEYIDKSVSFADDMMMSRLADCDLVISTTGNGPTDLMLNAYHAQGQLNSVLYGWLEPEAAAAHAVLTNGNGGCLRCGISELGEPNLRVTNWPDQGRTAVPACGGSFSAYGATELSFGSATVAEAALEALIEQDPVNHHHIWVGDPRRWQTRGGSFSSEWIANAERPTAGRYAVAREWPRVPQCPCCGLRERTE